MALSKFKITDELAFVAHTVFLFSSADLDLEDNGALYSQFGKKVMSYLEVYIQSSEKTKYILR